MYHLLEYQALPILHESAELSQANSGQSKSGWLHPKPSAKASAYRKWNGVWYVGALYAGAGTLYDGSGWVGAWYAGAGALYDGSG